MKTKKEIIDETVAYYSEDVTRRSFDKQGCHYKKEDKMCAFGRCLSYEGILQWGSFGGYVNSEMLPSLMDEYKIDDVDFWKRIQRLHDNDEHWDEKGLTDVGKEYVEFLHRSYD